MAYAAYIALLAVVTAVIIYLSIQLHDEKADSEESHRLFLEAERRLGRVREALADLPQSHGTEPDTIILRWKATCLRERNELWQLRVEAGNIDSLLNVPALASAKTRYDKIALSLSTNRKAAQGAPVSNRSQDY